MTFLQRVVFLAILWSGVALNGILALFEWAFGPRQPRKH